VTKEEFDVELNRIRRENAKSFVILRSMQEAEERINYIALGDAEVRDFANSDPAMLAGSKRDSKLRCHPLEAARSCLQRERDCSVD